MPTEPVPNTTWGPIGCVKDELFRAAVLTLFALLTHAPAMWRYIRKDIQP